MWWTALVNLISGGAITEGIKVWGKSVENEGDKNKMAAELAAKEVEAHTIIVTAQLKNWWSALPIIAMQLGASYYWIKVWVYDAAMGYGSTDALGPSASETMNLVILSMFGYNTAKLFRSRPNV